MFSDLHRSVTNFLKNEDGPAAMEYALMLLVLIVMCVTALKFLGTHADDKAIPQKGGTHISKTNR